MFHQASTLPSYLKNSASDSEYGTHPDELGLLLGLADQKDNIEEVCIDYNGLFAV